jgi:outer membrane PBP1 activator LpoA protein
MQALRYLVAPLLIVLLGGCGLPPGVKPKAPDLADPAVAGAEQLANQGDFLGAAALYAELAQGATAPQRGSYLIRAAAYYLRGGDRDGARTALAAVATTPLSIDDTLMRRLLNAEMLLEEKRASEALGILLEPPNQATELSLRTRYYRDTALAFRLMGNLLESGRELQALDGLLTDQQARFDNQIEIVRTLAVLGEQVLYQLQPSPPGIEGGWMQLAIVLKQATRDPQALPELVGQWRQSFPTHPALPGLLEGLLARQQALIRPANQIAVLLPERGRYDKVAAAVRDGLVAAWYQDPSLRRPNLRFYDSSDPAKLWPTYSRAVQEGADIVVGPLDKESVLQLARAGELPVPVLALNQVVTNVPAPPTMFQFSLAPEDEARQAAEHAWLGGKRYPLILAPTGEWGERIAAAFSERWQTLGGVVAGAAYYDPLAVDHSATIKRLLLLDASEVRHQSVQRLLGRKLEFEPRRRADADIVFLVSKPPQARALRPQLQFHHAADLPVIATSHAWNGKVDAREAPDLAGIVLPDMPWILVNDTSDALSRERLAQTLPAAGGAYGPLYAMGIDAYRLLPHLARLQTSPLESLDGYTGNLYADQGNRLHRQLVWAEIDVEPKVLGYAPRLNTEPFAAPGQAASPLTQTP